MNTQPISLSKLADGAVEERFNQVLNDVLKNIADINTDAKKKRTISLKVTFSPVEGRNMANLEFVVSSTLAPPNKVTSAIVLGEEGGQIVSAELLKQIPGQQSMLGQETPLPTNISQFKENIAK